MLSVREYDDGDAFWREVAAPLSARRVPASLFVGVAHASRSRADVLRFGVFDSGRLVLGALRTPPFRLNLTDFGDGEAAAQALAVHLADRGVRIPGVVGEERLAERFAERWIAKAGQRSIDTPGRRQNLYQIETVAPPQNIPGRMRPAHVDERDLLVRWEQGFADDVHLPPTESDPSFVAGVVDAGLNEGVFALWDADGAPRATARIRQIADVGARISGVYTPPDMRGRGYAAALTASLSQAVLDRGQFCCLFADAANPLTNRIYQRIGYVRVAGFADIIFSGANS